MLPKPSCLSVSIVLITAFAFGVTVNFYTFCRYTNPSVIFILTLAIVLATYAPFTPLVMTGNTRAIRLTASAGTLFGRLFPFTGHYPLKLLRCSCVRLSSIAQYSPLLPLFRVPPVFQCGCGCSYFHTSYGSLPWAAFNYPTS